MKQLHGITINDENQFVMTTLAHRSRGWTIRKTAIWGAHDRLRSTLLLSKGIHLGVPTYWRPPNYLETPDITALNTAANRFIPTTSTPHISTHGLILAGNLLSIVADDAYLCTIPLHLVPECHASFVAIYALSDTYRIGLIIDKKIVAVHAMTPLNPEQLESHLGRIQRYHGGKGLGVPIPNTLYFIDGKPGTQIDGWKVSIVNIESLNCGPNKTQALQGAGVALSQMEDFGPRFSGISEAAPQRKVRSLLLLASVFLLALSIAGTMGIVIASLVQTNAIANHKKMYERILAENVDIRQMAEANASTARKALRMDSTFSARTHWTQFLEELGALRVEGLYFEMLGTEPSDPSGRTMKVVLTGWAANESIITLFISRIQKSTQVFGVSLSSLERAPAGGICRFRLYCTLKLTDVKP